LSSSSSAAATASNRLQQVSIPFFDSDYSDYRTLFQMNWYPSIEPGCQSQFNQLKFSAVVVKSDEIHRFSDDLDRAVIELEPFSLVPLFLPPPVGFISLTYLFIYFPRQCFRSITDQQEETSIIPTNNKLQRNE